MNIKHIEKMTPWGDKYRDQNGNYWIYKESCNVCAEQFLAATTSEGKFCSISCLNKGRKVIKSKEIRERISQAQRQENHWNWQGGKSGIYCNEWRYIRLALKELDNNKCQNPYCKGKKDERLTSHHIDYNKQNCLPNNIITLCVSCNSRANFNRIYWQRVYTTLKNKMNKEE